MKRTLTLALICCTTSCFGGKNAVNLHGGYRNLTEDFENLSDQTVYGLEAVVGVNDRGWGVEGAGFYSDEESGPYKLETKELDVGIRKTFLQGAPIQIFLGAGPNWMEGNPSGGSAKDGIGAYAHAGAQFALFMFNLGVDFRAAYSGVKIDTERMNYGQATIFLGFSF